MHLGDCMAIMEIISQTYVQWKGDDKSDNEEAKKKIMGRSELRREDEDNIEGVETEARPHTAWRGHNWLA